MLVGVRHEPQHFAAVEFTLGLHPRRAMQGHSLALAFVRHPNLASRRDPGHARRPGGA